MGVVVNITSLNEENLPHSAHSPRPSFKCQEPIVCTNLVRGWELFGGSSLPLSAGERAVGKREALDQAARWWPTGQ